MFPHLGEIMFNYLVQNQYENLTFAITEVWWCITVAFVFLPMGAAFGSLYYLLGERLGA